MMNNNLKISIIVPIYNVAVFLPECLKSLINQTYKDIEIICIDDGSTDDSGKIAAEFSHIDSRVQAYTKSNGGLSSARNYGLDKATGDYIMFVDSDDWIDVHTCETAINKAIQGNYDLVFWSYTREFQNKKKTKDVINAAEHDYDETGCRLLHRRLFGLVDEELEAPDKGDTLVTAWGKLYKRELLENTRFVDTKIIGTEDALFNIQAFVNVHSAFYIPAYYYHYRKYNAQSLTTKYNPYLFERWQCMYQYMEREIIDHEYSKEYFEALSNRRALGLIALSQNIVASEKSCFEQKKELQGIICDKRYVTSFKSLKMNYLPSVWKIFFGMARYRMTAGVYILALIMQKIREK